MLNKNIFMEKLYTKCAPKTSPDPVSILVKNPKQQLHARNSFKSKIFKRGLSKKTLKKVNFLQVTKQVQKNSFIGYILSDQV